MNYRIFRFLLWLLIDSYNWYIKKNTTHCYLQICPQRGKVYFFNLFVEDIDSLSIWGSLDTEKQGRNLMKEERKREYGRERYNRVVLKKGEKEGALWADEAGSGFIWLPRWSDLLNHLVTGSTLYNHGHHVALFLLSPWRCTTRRKQQRLLSARRHFITALFTWLHDRDFTGLAVAPVKSTTALFLFFLSRLLLLLSPHFPWFLRHVCVCVP